MFIPLCVSWKTAMIKYPDQIGNIQQTYLLYQNKNFKRLSRIVFYLTAAFGVTC